MSLAEHPGPIRNMAHWAERVDLAAAFRWTARLDMHEGVANHFSLAVNEDGTSFLMNPNLAHFNRIRASDLLLINANDLATMERADAPDPTAWGLHGALHRLCPHARCALHVHPTYATVLACLADSTLPPIDQSTTMFFNRVAIDDAYDGLAFEAEAERCCATLSDPSKKVLVMGNHGIMVIGADVAETFNRLYYFERACKTYIKALSTQRPLRVLAPEIAEKTAREIETYPAIAGRHLAELKAILDQEGSDYAN